MKKDGKILYPFSLPDFFIGNGSESGIAGNGTGTRIDRYTESNKYERKYNGNKTGTGNLHRDDTLQLTKLRDIRREPVPLHIRSTNQVGSRHAAA